MIAYRDMRERHINKKQPGNEPTPRDPDAETQRTLAMLKQHGAAVEAAHSKPNVKMV